MTTMSVLLIGAAVVMFLIAISLLMGGPSGSQLPERVEVSSDTDKKSLHDVYQADLDKVVGRRSSVNSGKPSFSGGVNDSTGDIRKLFLIILFFCVGIFLYSKAHRAPVLVDTINNPGEKIEVVTGDFIWTFTSQGRISERWVYFDNLPGLGWIKYINTGFTALTPNQYARYLSIKERQCPAPFLNRAHRGLLIITNNQAVKDVIARAKRGDHILLQGFNVTAKSRYTGNSKYVFQTGYNKKSRLIYVSEASIE